MAVFTTHPPSFRSGDAKNKSGFEYAGFHFGTEGKGVLNGTRRSVNSCISHIFLLTCRCPFFHLLNAQCLHDVILDYV